ncbi:HTH domain-containing protein [Rhodococcus hoagii]|nr:HTH domain-containing protein [Prescottella equi]
MREARENGFTNQQIGDVLGVSETAVRNALKRAGGN